MMNEEAIQVLTERRITLGHDFGWDASMLAALEKAIDALRILCFLQGGNNCDE